MGDNFENYFELAKHYRVGSDFKIQQKNRGGKIIVLAPHGGGIELGTTELVTAIAGRDLSYYIFEGYLPGYGQNRKLHITSSRFDEPICQGLIGQFERSLSIHGCTGSERMIHLGGLDSQMKELLFTQLRQKDYPVQVDSQQYEGLYPDNICNRTRSGRGVQIELSAGFRRDLFLDWKNRMGRQVITKLFKQFVSDLREIILQV